MGNTKRAILNSDRSERLWRYETHRYPLTLGDIPAGGSYLEVYNPAGTQIVRNIAQRFMAESYFIQLARLEKLLMGDVNETTWNKAFPLTPFSEQLERGISEWDIYFHGQEMVRTLVDFLMGPEIGYKPQRSYALFMPDNRIGTNDYLLPYRHTIISPDENSDLARFLRKSTITPTHPGQQLAMSLYEDERERYRNMVQKTSQAICTTMVMFLTQSPDFRELDRLLIQQQEAKSL